MPCYRPLMRALDRNGNQIFYDKRDSYLMSSCYDEQNTVPCRQCFGCRMRKRLDWTLRGVNELQSSSVASFITLTFDNDNLPDDFSIDKTHVQKFLKRLRKVTGSIRYYACGEYGEQFGRPHYHLIIYGFDFPDKEVYATSKGGHNYYRSPLLEKCWKFGNSMVADVNMTTIAYVAKYAMKKITGDAADEYYERVNPLTGEVCQVAPEFQLASRAPALGRSWFEKFTSDVFPSDEIVFEGKQFPVPQYYLNLLEKSNPELHEEVKFNRDCAVRDEAAYKTVKRLGEIERCKILQQEKFLMDRNKTL